MPIYKTITVNQHTKVLIWNIEEPYEALLENVELTERCKQRVAGMKSDIHRRGFLSVRHLLKEFGYSTSDLFYDENGKPHLKDGKHISITHSFQFAGVVVSNDKIGIDIEMQRDKILRIAHKFTTVDDYKTLANTEAVVRKLTMVWCAKEALYKLYANPGVSFLQHMNIEDFDMETLQSTGDIMYKGGVSTYKIHFLEFDGFTCAYSYPLN